MKILRRGPEEGDQTTYKFTCSSCKSILKAKTYELRPFGFKNQNKEDQRYAFMCPVCNMQRVIRESDMKRVTTISEYLNKGLEKAVAGIEKREAVRA